MFDFTETVFRIVASSSILSVILTNVPEGMTDISVVKSYQETQHWPTGVRLIVADGNARVALAEDTDRLSVVVYSPRKQDLLVATLPS